ncbi:DUF305 domain-containing protein [Vibrio parahaemolyticus]|nr:DUF305 domain-containing protein [Vibrio parahaemolyticus]
MSNYVRFGLMITTSVVVMFCLKYLSTYEVNHVFYSETRAYMALMMGAAMTVIMLSFMLSMYEKQRVNTGIYIGSAVVFIAALFLLRSQSTVQDSSYMRSMIPHHSIAILTSERSEITDVRVRELADGIIKAQRKEIKEMEWLLDDIARNGVAENEVEARERPLPNFEGAL